MDYKDKNDIDRLLGHFFQSLPAETKNMMPLPFFLSRSNQSEIGGVVSEKSDGYNKSRIACFLFYKPISQILKKIDE